MTHLIDKFTDLLKQGRYNSQTIASYRNSLFKFYNEFREVPERQITDEMIAEYLQEMRTKKNIDQATIIQHGKAIKLFYDKLFNREIGVTITGQKKDDQTIEILTKNEIMQLIDVTENIKHKTILSLVYATGMRLAEILNIQTADISFETNTIHIRGLKNEKSRDLNLARNLKDILQTYINKYQPSVLLFEGEKGLAYSPRTIQLIFQNALKRAKIQKEASIHSLRHSYAVHLLEYGIDIHLVKEILGHKNVQTTSIYVPLAKTSLANIQSPIDY